MSGAEAEQKKADGEAASADKKGQEKSEAKDKAETKEETKEETKAEPKMAEEQQKKQKSDAKTDIDSITKVNMSKEEGSTVERVSTNY